MLPLTVQGRLAYYKDRVTGSGWPFNGQERRKQTVLDILGAIPFRSIVETGTYKGHTTTFFARSTDVPVYSVELDELLFRFSRARLRGYKRVTVERDNSVGFLRAMSCKRLLAEPSLFYLDAHWHDYCPLHDELEVIFKSFPVSVIVIDDFQVPYDDGYGYDDYDQTHLRLNSMTTLRDYGFAMFFPSAPSSLETGAKRGCMILSTDQELVAILRSIESLRFYGWSQDVPQALK